MVAPEELTDPLSGKGPLERITETPFIEQQVVGKEPEEPFGARLEKQGALEESHPTPMDLKAKQVAEEEIKAETLEQQTKKLINETESLKEYLTPERFDKIRHEYKDLFSRQLTKFSESVQGLSTIAHQPAPDIKRPSGLSKVTPFLELITAGQTQLSSAAAWLGAKGKGELSPSEMLLAQANLMKAERAVNFASAAVGKGIDMLRQLMQTQL